MSFDIPETHPRYLSLTMRHRITDGFSRGITASAGLIAHGRGEAYDYLIGEESRPFALRAIEAAAAAFLLAEHPVISVNGNSVVLSPEESVELAESCGAALEVNLFYRTRKREKAIEKALKKAGAAKVLGVALGKKAAHIDEIDHARRVVDPEGIAKADLVFVPLEDGDRTEALCASGKEVITVDLNPFSRTSIAADITIVDNLVRSVPLLTQAVKRLKVKSRKELEQIRSDYNNPETLKESARFMQKRLSEFQFERPVK